MLLMHLCSKKLLQQLIRTLGVNVFLKQAVIMK